MQTIAAKRVLILIIVILSMGLLVGCAGMKKATPERLPGYLYYPSALVDADEALNEARAAGKDKECPAEFNAAKDMVDKAYEIYMACRDKEAIAMAEEAIGKIKALCPPKPVAEVKPGPKPEPVPPAPAPKPEPTPPPPPPALEPVKIILEDIHFDFDKATLTKVATGILDNNIRTLKENPGVNVQIEGHTCAHGSEDYNMALGERRANAVEEYLVNKGIAAGRMTTISYGETRLAVPEIPTPKNKESKEAKANRRIHFEVFVK
jgi:outer membrane protein OmpA-like peptidoglycan-associated protein